MNHLNFNTAYFFRAGQIIADTMYRYRLSAGIAVWLLTAALILAVVFDAIPWDRLQSLGYVGLFFVTLINGATIVFGGPSQVATFFAGQKFSPFAVGIVAGLGTSIGELSGYVLGYTSTAFLNTRLGERVTSLQKTRWHRLVIQWTFPALMLLALVPNPFFDIVSIAAGMTKLPLRKYYPPVILGKMLRFVALAYAGAWLLS
ncbi:VTT domain-containing protein [Candidatus Kaiserbacteria bacterium]|nr:VTT domain-containing protein [Candidatus Kaiserbacteria bacterium]